MRRYYDAWSRMFEGRVAGVLAEAHCGDREAQRGEDYPEEACYLGSDEHIARLEAAKERRRRGLRAQCGDLEARKFQLHPAHCPKEVVPVPPETHDAAAAHAG